MTRRAAAILLLLLAAAVVALVLANRTVNPARRLPPRVFLRVTAAPAATTPGPGPAATPTETVRLTLFFPGQEDEKLRPEERDIAKPSGPGASLRAIFGELAKGPRQPGLLPAIPPKIQLRNAFLQPGGEAVLDLAVDASLAFGSDEELSIVAALVDTTLQNVADTNRVRILVNGEPAETLGGHVDVSMPLSYLRNELAAGPAEVPTATTTPAPQ
jgi:spore germination protein GerM